MTEVKIASFGTSSVTIKEKPMSARVKRKASQASLDDFCPEINGRPLKRPLLDSEKISLSDHGSTETLKTKRLLAQHVTVSIFEAIEAILQSLAKLVRSAHFEQVWNNEKEVIDSLLKICHLYDVVRVDGEDEKPIKKKEVEGISPEDNSISFLFNYLPLLREYVPSAVQEIESEIKAYVSSEGSGSVSTANDTKEIAIDYPSVQMKDEDDFNDMPDSYYDSEDSNAEDHPRNDYPNESMEDDKADAFGDSECPNFDYEEEIASKSKKDEETSNNGDEDMEAFSNSKYSDSEHDDENNLRLPDSDYDSEHSKAEDHPRNDFPDKESLEDHKADPFGDSECPNSVYDEEIASKSKKDEETSNNRDEDMEAFSNSEYSDSKHDDENNLRLPDSDYDSELAKAEDHPRNDYPDKESLEDHKADLFGDSECPNSDYDEEMASKSKKDEETSNNGDEDMEAFSNSEYSDSEHDDENNLRLPDSDYVSEHSKAEDHPRNDYPDKESLEDDRADTFGDSECSNSYYEEEMASKSKKDAEISNDGDEETSNNEDEDMEAFSNSEYSNSEHDDEDILRLPYSDYDSEHSNGFPDNESLEVKKTDPFGDSECSRFDYEEEMTSKSKKDEETSNNGEEDMEAFSNSEYSNSEHDDEDILRLPDSDYDSEHSNGFPDKESLEDNKADPFGDSECSSSDYEEEMASKSKKVEETSNNGDEETSNNGDEDMEAFSNSEYSNSEHDDEDILRLPYSDYDSEHSNVFPDKESLEDKKTDPFGDSECSSSDYEEEMASKSKKVEETSNNGDEETSNNGDEDMEAFSNSEYSNSEHDDEDILRLPYSDYDSEHSNVFPDKESLEDKKTDPFGDSECSSSDYEEEMASKSKKVEETSNNGDEETSNNGDEDMEAFSNSEYSNSEHDDEDILRLPYSDYDSEHSNVFPDKESLEDKKTDPFGDSECSSSDYEEEMASKSKKVEETSNNGDEETSNNGDEDMEAFSNSEYSNSEHDDEDILRLPYSDYDSEHSNVFPDKESLEDKKTDPFGDSECSSSDYEEEMASKSKKDEEISNNGDEDMEAFSNSEYSNSSGNENILEMGISLRPR